LSIKKLTRRIGRVDLFSGRQELQGVRDQVSSAGLQHVEGLGVNVRKF
jgi:hypothetical protein